MLNEAANLAAIVNVHSNLVCRDLTNRSENLKGKTDYAMSRDTGNHSDKEAGALGAPL